MPLNKRVPGENHCVFMFTYTKTFINTQVSIYRLP